MKKTAIAVVICFIAVAFSVNAYVMSSPSYRIQSDSLNIGGVRESSASYRMEDTIGEIATDGSTSASYKLKAGYQQMHEVYIGISSPADVTMAPTIPGISGGTGNGQSSWTVMTDNPGGYSLYIKASTPTAMQCASGGCNVGVDNFANYTPAGAAPDYNWSIAAANSEFGFSPEGSHIVQKYKDNGADTCNINIADTADRCWYNLSDSNENIASSALSNHPTGTATTVKFKAQSGASHMQIEGNYQATITVTAVSN